jgi:hypothetical protein
MYIIIIIVLFVSNKIDYKSKTSQAKPKRHKIICMQKKYEISFFGQNETKKKVVKKTKHVESCSCSILVLFCSSFLDSKILQIFANIAVASLTTSFLHSFNIKLKNKQGTEFYKI